MSDGSSLHVLAAQTGIIATVATGITESDNVDLHRTKEDGYASTRVDYRQPNLIQNHERILTQCCGGLRMAWKKK